MNQTGITRRAFLGGLLAAGASAALPGAARAALFMPEARTLSFLNLHTGERLNATYFEHGRYLPDAMEAISHVLRDHRNNAVKIIDYALMDQLAELRKVLGVEEPFQVISGYRSPESNALLRQRSHRVAKESLHVQGRAIDIRLKSRGIEDIRDAALTLAQGGVGFYRRSDFVHLDTGAFRTW